MQTDNLSKKPKLNPDRWVEEQADYLYSYTITRVYSTELAEDLVQETFLAAFAARDKFSGSSNERTWLTSILKRKIADHYRHLARTPDKPVSGFSSPFAQEGDTPGRWIQNRAPMAWDSGDLDEEDATAFYEILRLCLSLLPEKWAAIFNLKAVDEQKTDHICKEMQISATNMWVILHRSRLQLRECLENKWYKDEAR